MSDEFAAQLIEPLRRGLPRGGEIIVHEWAGGTRLEVAIWHPLPRLRFWRRASQRELSLGWVRGRLRAVMPAHVEVDVRWGRG